MFLSKKKKKKKQHIGTICSYYIYIYEFEIFINNIYRFYFTFCSFVSFISLGFFRVNMLI